MGLYWVTRILVLSQLLTGALAIVGVCSCSYTDTPQVIDPMGWPQGYILGAYDNAGNPCVPTALVCTLEIQSGNGSWGLTGFQLSTLTKPQPGGQVTVTFRNADKSVLGVYSSDTDPQNLTSQSKAASNSAKATVTIDYTGVGLDEQIKVVGSVNRIHGLNCATARPSTAKPTPAPTYAGLIPLNGNPNLVSNDIFFAVDIGRGNGDPAVFAEMMGVVNSIVSLLSITEDPTSVSQTRITVGSLSPVAGYSVFGNTWQTTQADVKAILGYQKIGRAASAYQSALTGAFNPTTGPFCLANTNDPSQNTRKDTTRLYIIVTNADPSDFAKTEFLASGYVGVDAHPIVLAYKCNCTKLSQLTGNGWSFFLMTDNSNSSIGAFVNTFLLNGDATCPLELDPTSAPTTDGSALVDMSNLVVHGHSHVTTANYQGPDFDSPTVAPWTRNAGTKARYCNLQNSNIYYKAKVATNGTKSGIKFTIFYELEPEKDFLRFYDSSWNELAAFTGYDVSGTNFVTTVGDVRVQFVSDEKNVYGGFQVVAENTAKSS